MGITQFYRSRFMIGNTAFPVPPGGGQLDFPENFAVPMYAGHDWQYSYKEGATYPQVDLTMGCLDGNSSQCPLSSDLLRAWFFERTLYSEMTRQHDTYGVEDVTFFDGYSGWMFAAAKFNSFQISGSKGDDVGFRANAMMYGPHTDGTDNYSPVVSVDEGVGFTGAPVRFQSLSFFKNGAITEPPGVEVPPNLPTAAIGDCLNGVMSFSISYTNNVTADASMQCGLVADSNGDYQSILPIDANAGIPTVSGVITVQSFNENVIQTGDAIQIGIRQGGIATLLTIPHIIINTRKNRNIGFGRQMRTYTFQGLGGNGNSIPPMFAQAFP